MRDLRPDVVVYDTLLPTGPQPLASTTRVVHVLRKSKPAQHEALLANPPPALAAYLGG